MSYTFDETLRMDRRLEAAHQMVVTQCLYIRPTDEFCNGCYWEAVLKPLIQDAIGWHRQDRPGTTRQVDEAWLHSMEAYDLVTDVWLKMLYEADPGNGHGFRKGEP